MAKDKEKQDKAVLPKSGLASDILGVDTPAGETDREEETAGQEQAAAAEKPKARQRQRDAGGEQQEVTHQYVTFFLGKEEYGLPIGMVEEINRVGDITRVPNSPAHVKGVINLRGKILPVIEFKARLGLGEVELTKLSRIVVVNNGAKVLGLMVDRVAQVVAIPQSAVEEAPEEVAPVDQTYVEGVAKFDGRMIILLDLGKVIGTKGKA